MECQATGKRKTVENGLLKFCTQIERQNGVDAKQCSQTKNESGKKDSSKYARSLREKVQ